MSAVAPVIRTTSWSDTSCRIWTDGNAISRWKIRSYDEKWGCSILAPPLDLANLPDGIDAEVAEGFEMRQRDAADGSRSLEAFWAEVGAVVSEDLINEVP